MTWVKSRLVDPSGSPIGGVCVKAALVLQPTWLATATSQVVSRAMTHTGPDGVWRLNLVPYTGYESQLSGCAFYRITEETTPPVTTFIRVPEADEDELWMRDLVFDPDPCSITNGFVPINTLARLHDVDASSLALAKPGDFLVLMPNGKWGAGRAPLPLTITWDPDPDGMQTVHISVFGFGGAGARVGFGDGSDEQTVYNHEPISHTYAQPGTYIVTATDVAWPTFTGTVKVGIKDHVPRATTYIDGDDAWRVLLWLDESADDTTYLVDWGDSGPITQTGGQNVGGTPPLPRVPHQYNAAGVYHVLVTDLATRRQSSADIEIGEIGALITYDTPSMPRTEWLWVAVGATWELEPDGSPVSTGIVPASGRVSMPSPGDVAPGDYGFEIREIVDDAVRRTAERRLTVPARSDERMDVAMTWRDDTDPAGTQTVTVTPNGARSRCNVEWGDGSASEQVDPGISISHSYQLPAPVEGWRLRLTETGVADFRTWTRRLAEPRHVGTPVMSARSRGAVDLMVGGIDDDYNDDWYSITWELGDPPEPMGAVGRWYPAHHVYASPGLKTIVLDGPGMPTPITREVNVVFYPAPTIAAVEERDQDGVIVDPNRMTARVTVDNTASGGPCTVWLGDETVPRTCAEVDSFVHEYLTAGNYDLVVASDADPSTRDRTTVTVPFGATRTLFFTLNGLTGDFQVNCTLTAKDPAKTVQVQWESGGPWETVPPSNHVSHVYPTVDATYDVVVAYTDATEAWAHTITIPWTP